MSYDERVVRSLKFSDEQVTVLRSIVVEKFGYNREHFAQALERAARDRNYHSPFLFPVNYNRHLLGWPVTQRPAQVYLDVLGTDSRLDFLKPLIDGRQSLIRK